MAISLVLMTSLKNRREVFFAVANKAARIEEGRTDVLVGGLATCHQGGRWRHASRLTSSS